MCPFLVSGALALACAGPVRAQGAPGAAESQARTSATVGRITVSGNLTTDSTRILRTFDVPRGSRFSQDLVKRGTRKLVALGLFSDVRVLSGEEHDGVVDLTIVVKERPRIASLGFRGNVKREDVDLEKKLFLRRGETYSGTLVRTQVDSLLQYYRDEGFPRTKITAQLDTLAERNEIGVTFVVEEGEKLRITRIRFEGVTAFSDKRLRKAMKTKTKGFFGGGELKDETFVEDREKLETWYHDHGYRDMHADDFRTEPGDGPKALTLVVSLTEGQRYSFGTVGWAGNRVVATDALAKLWGKKQRKLYDRGRIDEVRGAAFGEYAEHGYLYVGIEPVETVRDSAVDVTYTVTEGAPSHVRLVSITGNRGTRENVIRRELDVHEGDLFRRSALMRSRDDLNRLGIFEEVAPDFTPVDSTDVDLTFKVKEKQVGTASAGAGYTSTTGLTGFLELSHNNILGNGQQLALHLERGGRVENYSMSFTEPYFHDSPTLLGYSIYSTTSILTEFDEARRGGTARIGRPLPWPDYSRGSLSYTLESMKISSVRDELVLTGVPIDRWQLTSSLETNFIRNSANSAFYPTSGTRLTATDAFAGGPFGGDVNYHLHRYEGRVWLPSLFKPFTTMMRVRVGLMGQYPWKSGPVPDYTRFRLGGGTVIDPLRGYDDYQVVPPKFISPVKTYVSSVDYGWARDTTWSYPLRRYPGGQYMGLFTVEQQFPIVNPLHGVLFFDAGNTWDQRSEIQPFDLKCGAGFGFRMEIPILGNIGFDYGYGFNRDDGARWKGHFLLGNVGF